jgi:hypothetical protein
MVLIAANKNVKGSAADESDTFGGGSESVRTSGSTTFFNLSKYPYRMFLTHVSMVYHDTDAREGMRYLDSVVSKLEGSDYAESPAMANALALRAKTHSLSGETTKAIQDAQRVVKLKHTATAATLSMAYRAWADTETIPTRVIAVLQHWHSDQPIFGTKLQTEIQDLRVSMENDETGSSVDKNVSGSD